MWNVVKKLLKLKFTVNPVRDDRYISAKLKIFNKLIEQHLLIMLYL